LAIILHPHHGNKWRLDSDFYFFDVEI